MFFHPFFALRETSLPLGVSGSICVLFIGFILYSLLEALHHILLVHKFMFNALQLVVVLQEQEGNSQKDSGTFILV